MVDIRPLTFCLRLKVSQNRENRTIKLSQSGYIEKLLDCHSMLKAKNTKVFMQDTIIFSSDTPISKLEKAKYSAKVGSIMYTMVKTYIDIALTTSIVSQFCENS